LLAAAVVAAALAASACIAGELKRAGGGVLDTLHARRALVGSVAATATESALAGVSRGLRDSLQPRIDTTLAGLLRRLRSQLDTMTDSLEGGLTAYIRGSLDSATDQLVAHRSSQLAAAFPSWLAAASSAARTKLAPAMGLVADSAGTRLVRAVDVGLQGRLRPTLLALVREVAESVRVSAGRTTTPLLKRVSGIVWIIGGIVVAVVAGVVVVAWLRYRRSQQSLEAVASVVRRQGSEDLKDAIKAEATARKVEPWLHDYLSRRNLL